MQSQLQDLAGKSCTRYACVARCTQTSLSKNATWGISSLQFWKESEKHYAKGILFPFLANLSEKFISWSYLTVNHWAIHHYPCWQNQTIYAQSESLSLLPECVVSTWRAQRDSSDLRGVVITCSSCHKHYEHLAIMTFCGLASDKSSVLTFLIAYPSLWKQHQQLLGWALELTQVCQLHLKCSTDGAWVNKGWRRTGILCLITGMMQNWQERSRITFWIVGMWQMPIYLCLQGLGMCLPMITKSCMELMACNTNWLHSPDIKNLHFGIGRNSLWDSLWENLQNMVWMLHLAPQDLIRNLKFFNF